MASAIRRLSIIRYVLCGLCCVAAQSSASVSRADAELIGTASLAGDLEDASSLSGELAGGVPHNRLGGISAIEHVTGIRYLLLSDRGPADGATDWICRFHTVDIDIDPRRTPAVGVRLISTTTLRDGYGRNLVGSVTAFDPDDPVRDLRFDPEGIRQTRGGRLFISDEYGPSIYEFSTLGSRTRVLPIPRRFRIAHRSASSDDENSKNVSGRQANGGLEGLAITPDGTKLYGAMQRPLIQESRPAGKKRVGLNTRVLEFDLISGKTREFLYPLDDTAHGVSEILAVNDHEFLMLERDGRAGAEALCKKIFRIDFDGATDISERDALPPVGIPEGLQAVRKRPFIDLLSPRFGLAGADSPEKVEGLAFGPDLPDGRRLLLVAVDNDFVAERPILIYAFAIERGDLPNFSW